MKSKRRTYSRAELENERAWTFAKYRNPLTREMPADEQVESDPEPAVPASRWSDYYPGKDKAK